MKILITTGLTLPEVSEADLHLLRQAAPDAEIVVARSADEAAEHIVDAEVILGTISRQDFGRAARLRWVHGIVSGVDMLLYPEMVQSNVILSGEKGLVGEHLGDHAFALLLSLTRQLATAIRTGADSWRSRVEMRRAEFELTGMTMGVVGFGGTGRAVARRAQAFGMAVLAVDAEAVPPSPAVEAVWGMERFEELLRHSDVVTICCPLTGATRGLFDKRAFACMRPSAILINVTRGPIVDGEAIIEALAEGRLAAAGLDVTPEEPLPPDNPLWSMANVVITPHTAGASQKRAWRNMTRFAANLRNYREGRALEGLVDKAKGF